MAKKSVFSRTPEQEERDQLTRLERAQKRNGSENPLSSSSSSAPTTASGGRDFLDGFEQSIGVFGDSSVANGEAGQIFDYGQGLLQLHLADVGGGAVKLMSHYVWNAALVMAEYIEAADGIIDVRGCRVIEFGAGAALPGLLCVKRGADFVTLTDYPDPAIVQNLERNWYENLVESVEDKEARRIAGQESVQTTAYRYLLSPSSAVTDQGRRHAVEQRVKCAVRGHAWGESVQEMMDCLPAVSNLGSEALDNSPSSGGPGYDWILLADTLWVSEGHVALLESCCSVLSATGKIFVCCGLHTGYIPVQRFMSLARSDEFGFQTKLIEIRRMPLWGETRTAEELRRESTLLKEEDVENYSVEDRNRTVLVYELSRRTSG
ncbi:hypothetical protein BGZ58_001324 [Dissophora ornata]|nr:hypothetical protein BGZ58_001324 [Dissophora ornata]